MPEGDTSVFPADGERVDDWVPLHLDDRVLASLDLEVGHDGAFIAHEDDSRLVGGDGEHQVTFIVGPRGLQTLLVFSNHMVLKEHTHLNC